MSGTDPELHLSQDRQHKKDGWEREADPVTACHSERGDDPIVASPGVVVEDGRGEAVVSDVVVGENFEEERALTGVSGTGAELRDVVEGVVLGSMPDHAAAPDDFKKEVEVGLQQLDDAKAVNARRPWIFF